MAESNNRTSEEDPVQLEVSVEFLKREHQECVICATDSAKCFDIQKTHTSHCISLHAFLFKHTNVNFDSEGDRYICKICLDFVNELEQAELEYVKLKHSFELIISKNPLFYSLEKKMSLKKLKFSSDRDELSEKFNDEKDSFSTIMKLETMSDEDRGKEVGSEPDGPKTRQKQTVSAKPPAIGGAAPRKQITVKKGKGKKRKSSEKHPITSEKYQCVICQRQFSQKGNYNRHLTTHSGVMPFECPTCQRRFNRKDHLLTHIRTHTGEKPFECNFCLVKFNQKGSIIKHSRTHTGQEPFECNICHRRFKQRPHLNSHLRSHTGEKPYECNYCKRRFIESTKLKIHLRTHTGERPYGCTYCNRQFNQSGNLQSHLRTHTGEKPYECVMCQRRFNLKHHLRDHLSSHTGEKAFECSVCKQRFNYKHVMQKHMKVMHHPMVCPSYEIAMNAEPEIIIKVND